MKREKILESFINKLLDKIPSDAEDILIEEVIDLMRKTIYQDFPNADPMIVEFNIELLRNLIEQTQADEKMIEQTVRASKKTFQSFYK